MSDFQLKVSSKYNITIYNVKKQINNNYFDKENHALHCDNFKN